MLNNVNNALNVAHVQQRTPDQMLQDVVDRVANRSVGGKIASVLKSAVGKTNPSADMLRQAISANLGGNVAATRFVMDQLGLKKSSSLTSAKVAQAIDLTHKMQVAINSPLFQHMGEHDFMLNLRGALSTMKQAGVTPVSVVAHGQQPLSFEEIVALREYTEQSFYTFNQEIRTGNMSPLTTAQAHAMDTGLAKLPGYTGQVLRGTDMPPQQNALHQVGQNVGDATFSSSSKDVPFKGSHQIVIQCDPNGQGHGHDISFLSSRPEEHEVLFERNVQFQVLSREGGVFYNDFMGKQIPMGNVDLVLQEQ